MADETVKVLRVLSDDTIELDRPDPTGTYKRERMVIVGAELLDPNSRDSKVRKKAQDGRRWLRDHLEGKSFLLDLQTQNDAAGKEVPARDKSNRVKGNLFLPPPPPKKDEFPSMDNAFDLARDLIAAGFAVLPARSHVKRSALPLRRGQPAVSFLDRVRQCTELFGDVPPQSPLALGDVMQARRQSMPFAERMSEPVSPMFTEAHMPSPSVEEVRRLIALGGGPTDATIQALLDAGIPAEVIAQANAPATTIHNPLAVWKVIQDAAGNIIGVVPPGGTWTGAIPAGGHVGVAKENPLKRAAGPSPMGRGWGAAGTDPNAAHPGAAGTLAIPPLRRAVEAINPLFKFAREEAEQAERMRRIYQGAKGPKGAGGVQGPKGPGDVLYEGLEKEEQEKGGFGALIRPTKKEHYPPSEKAVEPPASVVMRQGIAHAAEFNQMVGAGRVAGLSPAYQKAVNAAAQAGNPALARNLVLQGEAERRHAPKR